MDLWSYAVSTYARPGVEAACLVLQDEHGQCAPLLLWRLWAAAEGRPVDERLVADAAAAAQAWDALATAPLRRMRRRLKLPLPPFGKAARADLREDIKAAELRAERMLLETLEAMTPPPAAGGGARDPALGVVARAWNGTAPEAALAALARAAL